MWRNDSVCPKYGDSSEAVRRLRILPERQSRGSKINGTHTPWNDDTANPTSRPASIHVATYVCCTNRQGCFCSYTLGCLIWNIVYEHFEFQTQRHKLHSNWRRWWNYKSDYCIFESILTLSYFGSYISWNDVDSLMCVFANWQSLTGWKRWQPLGYSECPHEFYQSSTTYDQFALLLISGELRFHGEKQCPRATGMAKRYKKRVWWSTWLQHGGHLLCSSCHTHKQKAWFESHFTDPKYRWRRYRMVVHTGQYKSSSAHEAHSSVTKRVAVYIVL